MTTIFPKQRSSGFTIIELLITHSILGIIAGIAVPAASSYLLRAQYNNLKATLHQLMDGEDTYFLLNGTFYPTGFGSISIDPGETVDIPELSFKFGAGNKYRYVIRGINLNFSGMKLNYYYIYVYTDFDYDRNGRNDLYLVMTQFRDDEPYKFRGVVYDRYLRQIW